MTNSWKLKHSFYQRWVSMRLWRWKNSSMSQKVETWEILEGKTPVSKGGWLKSAVEETGQQECRETVVPCGAVSRCADTQLQHSESWPWLGSFANLCSCYFAPLSSIEEPLKHTPVSKPKESNWKTSWTSMHSALCSSQDFGSRGSSFLDVSALHFSWKATHTTKL